MAMGDKIDCPVGGVVETTLQLDFKKAQTTQLPDAPNFRFAVFTMASTKGNKTDERRVKPPSVEVTQDDQRITVRWQFVNEPEKEGPGFFAVGEEWNLFMSYVPTADNGPAPKGERLFTLGTVKLVAP
jgi:hypothetical protein